MRVTRFIKRREVQANPGTLYIFGDNDIRKGLGGQAREMRGENNAVGISTKKYPTNESSSFKSDEELEKNKSIIREDINGAIKKFKSGQFTNIVIPRIGVGLARLQEKAPLTWDFLQSELIRLEEETRDKNQG